MLWCIITLPAIFIEVFFHHYWSYMAEQFLSWLLLEMPQPSLRGRPTKNEKCQAVGETFFVNTMPLADVPISFYCLVQYQHLDFTRFVSVIGVDCSEELVFKMHEFSRSYDTEGIII